MCIKNFKKTFVTFVATLVMMFALVACSVGSTSTAATEARKNLKDAVDQIALEHTMDLKNVVDDIKLNGVLVQFGAKVTWESSDEKYLKIEADGANYIAKVTRPQPSEENAQVTLTATISVEYTDTDGTTKSVSDEKSYTLTITKKEPAETLTDAKAKAAAELAANGKTEYSTNFYATVTAVMKDGQQFFVTDGTTGIYVYIACEGIKVGDVVNVQGVFSTYYGTLQIAKDGGAVTVLEADAEGLYHDEFGNVLYTAEGPLKSLQGEEAYAQDITVSDLVNQDTVDGCFGGQAATLYGKLVHEKYLANTYDNYFLIDPYTAERVLVYYKSFTADDEALLAPYLGQYVTINVATYDQKNEDGMGIVKRVAIVAESVKAAEAPTMTDEEKLANLLAGLQLPGTVESEYTLSTEATWEVVEGNATIENGVLKVTQAAEEQTVVVRATVTVGELSDTKEFTVTVPSSKIEVLTPTQAAAGLQDAANDGLVLHVGGFVAEGSKLDKYGNFVLEDAQGGTVTIYGGFGKDAEGNYLFNSIKEQYGIEVGVYVVVKGKYTTNFNNVTGTEIISASVDATKAAAGLADAANDGLEVLVHGTIAEGSKLDKYGNFVLEDANGGTVTIYGGFGKDAEGNYLFPSIQEQLGLAVGVKVVVRGTYTVNYKNITGLEILMAMAAGETPEPEEHVHTACPECGGCTAEDCTGTEEEKCAGHEVEPEQPQSGVAELTVNSLGIASQTYAAGTATINGVAFEFIQIGNYGDGIQMRDKNGNTSQLWNTSAFGAGIVKIELTYSASKDVTYANADAVIFTFGNSAKEAAYTTKLSTEAGVKSYTITPDASTYTFFYLEHDLGYTFYWESIKVYFAAGGETPEQPEQPEQPEVPTHEHDLCPVCQKCLKEDCPEEKCAGHEVEPEQPQSGVAELTVNSLGIASQTYAAGTATINGVAFEFIQIGNYGDGIQMRDKNGNTSQLWNTSAFGAGIVKIELTYSASKDVTYANADAVIFTFGNSAKEAAYTTKLSTEAGVKSYTITPDASTYTFFYLEHDLGYTFYWESIKVYFAAGGETPEQPEQPEVPTHEHDLCPVCQKCLKEDCPEEKCAGHEVEPETPAFGVVAAPVAGTAYKFGMVQGNLNKTYYLAGGMSGYYMATTEDASAALDVYLEATEGGYYLYCMVNGVKTYINMVVSGTHVNGAYEATASTVHTYNEESKTLIALVNDTEYWYGTRNDKTYTTVGPCAVSYAGFYCQFYGATTGETPEQPEQPEVPTHEHDLCAECGKCLKEDCPEEKCAGHEVEPETPVTAGGKADLETMDPATTNGGTGQYTKPLTSTSGWYCENSALLIGGTSDANPVFIFIGADNTTKAVTINGKTAAKGFLKSPTLAGGISKLTFNYGHAFKEANGVNITITITEVATGNKVELTLVKTNAEVVQKTAYVAEFVLDAPIVGEFTIEFTNNSPTNSSSSNKDRVSLWNIEWVGAAA